MFRQPSGSDEGADDDPATGQPKAAQGANDPIASGLPRIAIPGRPFLSERRKDNWFRYYKGGLAEDVPALGRADYATLVRASDQAGPSQVSHEPIGCRNLAVAGLMIGRVERMAEIEGIGLGCADQGDI